MLTAGVIDNGCLGSRQLVGSGHLGAGEQNAEGDDAVVVISARETATNHKKIFSGERRLRGAFSSCAG